MTWQWSTSANRYRDSVTGRFLSPFRQMTGALLCAAK